MRFASSSDSGPRGSVSFGPWWGRCMPRHQSGGAGTERGTPVLGEKEHLTRRVADEVAQHEQALDQLVIVVWQPSVAQRVEQELRSYGAPRGRLITDLARLAWIVSRQVVGELGGAEEIGGGSGRERGGQ